MSEIREAAIPNLESIDRLPVGEAIEFYLNAAEELVRTCELRALDPNRWKRSWYRLDSSIHYKVSDWDRQVGRR